MKIYWMCIARLIAGVHLMIIGMNLVSVPLLIAYQPFYIWMPMITILVSPVLGGSYCMFNRLENHFRYKAGMPLISDRVHELIKRD